MPKILIPMLTPPVKGRQISTRSRVRPARIPSVPDVESSSTYDDYGPAYGYGVNSFGKHKGRSFDEAEPELSRDWESARGTSNLTWDKAKSASRDAWNKLSDATERAVPGDSDRDGKQT